MASQKPLDPQQNQLVGLIRVAHTNLQVAHRSRSSELARRLRENKLRIERDLEQTEAAIKINIDYEMAQHQSSLDETIIAAFNAGVPIRRIALDGFGNQYDGQANARLVKLRDEGRVGTKINYQRGSTPNLEEVVFPQPVVFEQLLSEATVVAEPAFKYLGPTEAADGTMVGAVTLTIDGRDPWLKTVQDRKAYGATHSLSVVLFINPYRDNLMAFDASLDPELRWDNAAAYWVATHAETARASFDAIIAALAE